MNYDIHITRKAELDLNEAADYIEFTLLNPKAADDLLDKVDEEISKLSYMPEKHKVVEDPILSAWGIRFIVIANYIALYVIDSEAGIVHIVRFLYSRRNWVSILRHDPPSLD